MASTWKWATITQIDGGGGFSVKLDGDSSPLPFQPDSLIDPLALAVGDRVRIQIDNGQPLVTGRAGGDGSTPPVKNGSWREEKIGANLYRWTQITSVTATPNLSAGNMFYGVADLPAPPDGATISRISAAITGWFAWASARSISNWGLLIFVPTASNTENTYAAVITLYGTK